MVTVRSGIRLPLYRQIAQKLRSEIEEGRFGLDGRLPDERELAVQLKVSRATVRQAMKVLRELGLVRRVQGSGTYVSLGSDRAGDKVCLLTIGEVAKYHPFVVAVMLEAQGSARQAGWAMHIENCVDIEQARQRVRAIQADPTVRGGIITGWVRAADAEVISAESRIPWVVIGEYADGTVHQAAVIDQVVGDDFHRARLAARHLIERGCRAPALFVSGQEMPWSRDAISAFRMVCDDASIPVQDQQVLDIYSPRPANQRSRVSDRNQRLEAVQKVIDYWNTSGRWPDGIICQGPIFDVFDLYSRTHPDVRERLVRVSFAVCGAAEIEQIRQSWSEQIHVSHFLTSIREMTDLAMRRLREPFPRLREPVRDYARSVRCPELAGEESPSPMEAEEVNVRAIYGG